MTGLGLPLEDERIVSLRLNLETAERWDAAARAAGFSDVTAWLRDLANRAAPHLP